ncbi:hypothetical protein D3C76_701100 [compost metagenome]
MLDTEIPASSNFFLYPLASSKVSSLTFLPSSPRTSICEIPFCVKIRICSLTFELISSANAEIVKLFIIITSKFIIL